MDEAPILPKKCCANCGYLYGVSRRFRLPQEIIFDPDLLRDAEYPPPPMTFKGEGEPGIIGSGYYSFEKQVPVFGGRPLETTTMIDNYPYTWASTSQICCYHKKFVPIYIFEATSGYSAKEALTSYPESIDHTLFTIRQDRTDCTGYFAYLPGFTPQQHVQIQLEEDRLRRLEAHDEELARFTTKVEEKLRGRDWFVLIGIAIIGGLFAIIASILQPYFTYLFNNP